MILINLLPHREERRLQRKRAFFVALGVAAGAGALMAGLWYGALQQMTQTQQQRNGFLKSEIGKLEGQIKDIANLRAEIDSLKARQAAVEDLQLNRNVPVHLLDELVRLTPEGIYLTGVKQTDNTVLVSGVAQTNERVSEFLRNAQSNSPRFSKRAIPSCAPRSDALRAKSRTSPACAPRSRASRPGSVRLKTCSSTATCRCTCWMNWCA